MKRRRTMHPLNSIRPRGRRAWAAAVVLLVTISGGMFHPGIRRDPFLSVAATLPCRLIEARIAGRCDHRPFRPTGLTEQGISSLRSAALLLEEQWHATHDRFAGRKSAEAELLADRPRIATVRLTELLDQDSEASNLLEEVSSSQDTALLIDFSAAMLQRSDDPSALALAFEAADRAWQLAHAPSAAWNRALAIDRMGIPRATRDAWRNVLEVETSFAWRREASVHELTAALTIRGPSESPEFFFLEQLPTLAETGAKATDRLAADHLASDIGRSLAVLLPQDRERLHSAIETYADGRTAFAREDLDAACHAFSVAEQALASMKTPLALLVREQNIRCRCLQTKAVCLDEIRALRGEIVTTGRYPWLAARAAYAEGQTLYREGRIREAAERFRVALREFQTVGDAASAGLAHSVLGNAYGVAGETDAALEQHIAAIRSRFRYPGDRRRIVLEDAMFFFMRHGYTAIPELLIDELCREPTAGGGRVIESALRGVIAFRRGNRLEGERQFERAHRLLDQIGDARLRSEAKRSVLIAEAGCGLARSRRLADIDNVTTMQEQDEGTSLWLPRLLTERGIDFEFARRAHDAEQDYLHAIALLERREPRVDQSVLVLGGTARNESAFDRLIRLYVEQNRIEDALMIAQRSTSLRISSVIELTAGVKNVFRSPGEGRNVQAQESIRTVLPAGHVAVAQYLLNDELLTWIVTRAELHLVRRRVRANQVIAVASRLFLCGQRDACVDGPEVERMSDLLLRDWITAVPPGATLWLQMPVELQGMPVAMLKTSGGERLLLRNPITNAPSLQVFIGAQQRDLVRRGHRSAWLGAAPSAGNDLPPLPGAAAEIRAAARAYTVARVDTKALRSTFADLPEYSIVHFAGHVLVNSEQPLFSAMVFEDGLLYVHEFDRCWFQHVRLMVLSGCDTGRSPRPTMSVAGALLHQDVPSVIYTLWPLDDAVAVDFSRNFHRAIAAGKSRAEALQSAERSIWEKYPNRPSAWAAFQLAGAPGPVT